MTQPDEMGALKNASNELSSLAKLKTYLVNTSTD